MIKIQIKKGLIDIEPKQIEELSKTRGCPGGLIPSEGKFDFEKDFKQEWNPAEVLGVETWIKSLFLLVIGRMGVRGSVEDYFGLSFTDSPPCAMYRVCNVKHYMTDKHYISFFALSNNGFLYIVCHDEEGNEVIFGG